MCMLEARSTLVLCLASIRREGWWSCLGVGALVFEEGGVALLVDESVSLVCGGRG